MVEEISVAQDILVEDRIEATNDRQIEEIDEQMRAWSRFEAFVSAADSCRSKAKGDSTVAIVINHSCEKVSL